MSNVLLTDTRKPSQNPGYSARGNLALTDDNGIVVDRGWSVVPSGLGKICRGHTPSFGGARVPRSGARSPVGVQGERCHPRRLSTRSSPPDRQDGGASDDGRSPTGARPAASRPKDLARSVPR